MAIGIFWAAAIMLCLAAPAMAGTPQWNGSPVPIHKVNIRVDNQKQHNAFLDWNDLARDIIALNRGDLLTREKLDAATAALEAFGHQSTDIAVVSQGAVIDILLLPYQRIKSIELKGVYPLFERDIRNLMTVSPGDIFNPATLMDQNDLIVRRYQKEGYIAPQVNLTWEHDDDDGHVDVRIHIQKGDAYNLSRIKVTGNSAVPDALILGLMSTWRSSTIWQGVSRWVESRLKKDIDTIESYYRGQGHADVNIEYAITKQDPADKTVEVRVKIDEGRRYKIEYEGNRHFSENILKKDLAVFEKGNRGNIGLRRTVQNIRRRYLKAGFADAQVQWQEISQEDDQSTERHVRIEIQEGGRHIVRAVTIAGNQAISTEAIKAQMLTRPPQGLGKGAFVPAVLNEDMTAVAGLYHKYGYQDARIAEKVDVTPETHKVIVTLDIEEGVQTRVGEIRIEGNTPIPVDELSSSLPLTSGEVFQPQTIGQGENELSARIAAKGYPHVQVQQHVDISEDRTRADIVYHIDAGPEVEIGRIFWVGNFRTRNSLLSREIKLEQGEPFSLVRVLAAQRRLRDLDLFRSVQIRSIGLKERAAKVHLLITMVEKPAYYFELGTGFRTDKGFYGRTKVGDRNFLGLNKEIRMEGEISGIGYRWDAGLAEPSFLGTSISANLGFFTERREEFNQDFGTDTTGGHLTFSRPWGKRLFTALGVRYERREQFLRERDASTTDIDPETLEPRTIWVTTPAVRYDSRDSFIRPRTGHLASLIIDLSKGLDSSLDDFVRYKVDLRTYFTPTHRLTLAGHALGGYLHPYGVDGQIPEDQLFFLGGTNDVRGFGENLLRFNDDKDPVGGQLAMAGSIEARYALPKNWELTLFVDTGTVRQALTGENDGDEQWQWTTGLGLRYITPIGPIGILYGYKLNPRSGESDGQFHFSIGYTF